MKNTSQTTVKLFIKERIEQLKSAGKDYGNCPILHKGLCEGAPSADGMYIEMCRCGRGNVHNEEIELIAQCRKFHNPKYSSHV